MIRAVLDTNVLVSAAIKKDSKPERILLASGEHFTLLCSEYIRDEVDRVLSRRHIRKLLPNAGYREQFVVLLEGSAEFVRTLTAVQVSKDPKDNPVLACALDGKADYLVSGDRHLLALGTFKGIQIVTAEQFLRALESRV